MNKPALLPVTQPWRFGLFFKRACPFTVGDGVLSGIVDDFGRRIHFVGAAHVEKTEVTLLAGGQVRSRAVVRVTPRA